AFLEQQPHRVEPVPLSIATAFGSSRLSVALVSGAAALRRESATADRLCADDPARLPAAAVVPGHESAGGGALQGRHGEGQHQALDPRARDCPVPSGGVLILVPPSGGECLK